jgi:hypothetical protein
MQNELSFIKLEISQDLKVIICAFQFSKARTSKNLHDFSVS